MAARKFLTTQLGPNGAVSGPTYGFTTSSSGAGLYATGTDAIALATTGAARLSINSTGQVAIAGNVAFNGATPTTPPDYEADRGWPSVAPFSGTLYFPAARITGNSPAIGGLGMGLVFPSGTPKLTFGQMRQTDSIESNVGMMASVLVTLISDLQAIGILT